RASVPEGAPYLATDPVDPPARQSVIVADIEKDWSARHLSRVEGLGESLRGRLAAHFAKYGELADLASASERLAGDAVGAIIGQPNLFVSDFVAELAKGVPAATKDTLKKLYRISFNNF